MLRKDKKKLLELLNDFVNEKNEIIDSLEHKLILKLIKSSSKQELYKINQQKIKTSQKLVEILNKEVGNG